jgi:hypothetical protein
MTRIFLAMFIACVLAGQAQHQPPVIPSTPGAGPDTQLPNGKSQREEMLKLDHKKNLEDAAALVKLSGEVSEDLEKDDRYVVSLKTLKKLDEIEKLTKAIRGRLKKY